MVEQGLLGQLVAGLVVLRLLQRRRALERGRTECLDARLLRRRLLFIVLLLLLWFIMLLLLRRANVSEYRPMVALRT